MSNILLKNKKATWNYSIEAEYITGIKLVGSEVKSIRHNGVSFNDCYCIFKNNKIFIKNLHISEYKYASYLNHEPLRDRELLLTKKQLKQLDKGKKEKGLTIIPINLAEVNGYFKIKIGLCKGKKLFDKRNDLKKKTQKREIDKQLKENR